MEEKGKDTRIFYLVIGFLMAVIVLLAGGKLREISAFGTKIEFPTETPNSTSISIDTTAISLIIQQTSVAAIQQTSVALQQLQPVQPIETAIPTIVIPEIQPTAFIFETPTSAPLTCKNALRNVQSYSPGQVITGTATLHPFEGCTEMASQLGFVCIGYWGINIKAGQSIVIPDSVTLVGGKVLSPPLGTFSTYENDGQMEGTQSFWLADCK